MRRTKIIATLGPASNDEGAIAALVEAGVNVFRLNFSHGTTSTHGRLVELIRTTAADAGREVAILQDLSGPKIRTGKLAGGEAIELERGQQLRIGIGSFTGDRQRISTSYAPLAAAVKPGDKLLLDDGKVELAVESATPDEIVTRVVDGGALGQHKGINAPNVPLPAVGVTEKDEADLRFGLSVGVDLVALSFVQSAADVARARDIAASAGHPTVPIIAKLERPEAVRRLKEIMDGANAVMVARGDLGLELPLEQVPQVQKEILRLGRERGVPVIVATQVLESMRTEPRPTRAEVADAAGAVDAGADGIMLSGETAVGAYPVRAVQVLDNVIRNAEASPPLWTLPHPTHERPDHLPPLCDAAVTLAGRSQADALICITREGRTARLLSARRPAAPIYAVTDREDCARRLCLWWGVAPLMHSLDGSNDQIVERAVERLRAQGLLPSPAVVVVVNAQPELERGAANFVRIRRL